MTNEPKSDTEGLRELLRTVYADFNARRMEEVLAWMHPEVEWPNGWEGGYVHGREGIREYWTRQWAVLDPKVEPAGMEDDGNGGIRVRVRQVVHDLKGNLISDTYVGHVYRFRDGLIARMDIQSY